MIKSSEEYKGENESKTNSQLDFYKKNDSDVIWWVENPDKIGEHLFTFDKSRIYNLFKDYPYELSNEEKEIFDRENPYWVEFFKDRQISESNNSSSDLICPICNGMLSSMMPDGKILNCPKCNKYYINDNGTVGAETSSPYTRNDVFY